MKRPWTVGIVALAVLGAAANAGATTIDFEGVAPAGGLVNVSPAIPYTEDGFTLTPTNDQSAVFDSAAAADLPGDATDWFGWQENNIITLTGPSPFSLNSLLLGRSTIATGASTSITLVGHLSGGGTLNATFAGLTTATLETLNWSNLSSVEFRATDDSGMDDIVINAIPEPGSMILLATGGLGLIARARNRRKQNA